MFMFVQREVTDASKLAQLQAAYHTLSPQAIEYSLACVNLPSDVSNTIFGVGWGMLSPQAVE